MRIHIDKIASVTRNLRLARTLTLTDDIQAVPGAVVAGRVIGEKTTYNQLEDVHGRMSILHGGDIMVGALGHRNALHGYEGVMPSSVTVGDRLNILNLGGVIGTCVSHNPDVGRPFEVEILGQVLVYPDFGSRVGQPATIQMGALEARSAPAAVPVVFVAGTCMNAGKTVAATELVRGLARGGLRVAATKLTGVSLMRDALSMQDAGAVAALTFNDAGAASTHAGMTVPIARGLFNRLADPRGPRPDVIVAELGDGILGEYGVQDILRAKDLMALGAAYVMAAPDPVGCWGAREIMRDEFNLPITAITGPATDNAVGRDYISASLGLPAFNSRRDPEGLVGAVRAALEQWHAAHGASA